MVKEILLDGFFVVFERLMVFAGSRTLKKTCLTVWVCGVHGFTCLPKGSKS